MTMEVEPDDPHYVLKLEIQKKELELERGRRRINTSFRKAEGVRKFQIIGGYIGLGAQVVNLSYGTHLECSCVV
jgi:hypothetical protein